MAVRGVHLHRADALNQTQRWPAGWALKDQQGKADRLGLGRLSEPNTLEKSPQAGNRHGFYGRICWRRPDFWDNKRELWGGRVLGRWMETNTGFLEDGWNHARSCLRQESPSRNEEADQRQRLQVLKTAIEWRRCYKVITLPPDCAPSEWKTVHF